MRLSAVTLTTRWYIRPLGAMFEALADREQLAVERQALIGALQTLTLAVMLAQAAFAGVLRALPPDLRAALGFLHRIEWGVYAGAILIAAQIITSWQARIVLTNRIYLLAWPFGRLRLLRGHAARIAEVLYALLAVGLIIAALYVRANGFIVQPSR